MLEPEICVVGAGAAGLWAAARVARLAGDRPERRGVLLLEKTPRTGTKVLASGGTRCNLTTTLDADRAARLFGPRGARFLRAAFRALPPEAVRGRFAEWGVETVEEPLEKVFPRSGSAREVRDALEREARAAGAAIRCGAGVAELAREEPRWRLRLADGETVRCRSLLLCPGGRSYPRTGTTGDGYAWLADLGLPLVEPVPALVPLTSPAPWVHALTGIALQEVEARLVDPDGRVLGRRRRPVLFTHRGLSGPGAMDLSEPVAREEAAARSGGREPREHALLLDLAPERGWEDLRAELVAAAGRPGRPGLARALPIELPRRVLQRVAAQAGLEETGAAADLSKAARHRLIEALKGLAVPVGGTLGFDQAEVTAGGLALSSLDPRTLRVNGWPGLYAFGEVLDLAGPIGGLNFQSAFATAELAAAHAAGSG